jgi:hypothetical protein
MTEVQIGSTFLPIKIKPHIGGVAVTQQNIKDNFSNLYVDDPTTPLTWVLEWKRRTDTAFTSVAYDAALTTETEIYFDMPDTFWANIQKYTVLVAWVVTGLGKVEKIYNEEEFTIDVRDLHKGR